MKRLVIAPIVAAWCVLIIAGTGTAVVPETMNYQGVLLDAVGNPVTTPRDLVFSFYDSTGVLLWSDTVTVDPDGNGQFDCGVAISNKAIDPQKQKDAEKVGVQVVGDLEMVPRFALGSAPFSQYAGGVSGDIDTGPGTMIVKKAEQSTKDSKENAISLVSDSSGASLVLFSSDGLDTLISFITSSGGPFAKSPSAANLDLSRSNVNRIHFTSSNIDSTSSMVMLGMNGDTLYSVFTGSAGALAKGASGPSAANLDLSRANVNRIYFNSSNVDSTSSIVILGTNGDTLYSVFTGSADAVAKGATGPSAANLDLSRSNVNRITLLSDPLHCSIAMTDTFGVTNVVISDVSAQSKLRDVLIGGGTQSPSATLHVNGTSYLNGVTTIADGGRVQSEVNGGARILGEQGNTPDRPAIGFFSSDGVYDGGGVGIGIYRPAAHNMAFSTFSTERMRITTAGLVGINTPTPTERLSVNGNICATGTITGTSAGCGVSDARFKTNVAPLEDGLGLVMRLRGVRYDWDRARFPERDFSDARQVGFIAQEIKEVLPELVTTMSDGYYAVDYGRLAPVLVEAIKELKQKTDQIAALQTQVTELQAQMQKLALQNQPPVTTAQVER